MKFCKDCKHISRTDTDTLEIARCAALKFRDADYPVTGEEKMPFCALARLTPDPIAMGPVCGPEAKLFEEKS